MKITPEHYQHLVNAIAAIPAGVIADLRVRVAEDARVNDPDKRFRWDILHVAVPARWICDHVYPYANDTHLDTALRAATRELNIAF